MDQLELAEYWKFGTLSSWGKGVKGAGVEAFCLLWALFCEFEARFLVMGLGLLLVCKSSSGNKLKLADTRATEFCHLNFATASLLPSKPPTSFFLTNSTQGPYRKGILRSVIPA